MEDRKAGTAAAAAPEAARLSEAVLLAAASAAPPVVPAPGGAAISCAGVRGNVVAAARGAVSNDWWATGAPSTSPHPTDADAMATDAHAISTRAKAAQARDTTVLLIGPVYRGSIRQV
jgi:hypothetical protein